MATSERPAGPPPPVKPPPQSRDWARVQYERNGMSTKDISIACQVTQTTIVSWVSKDGWVRNPQDVAQRERQALVLQDQSKREQNVALIERVNVEMQARVLSEHRTEISRLKKITSKLWKELDENVDEHDLMDRTMMLQRLVGASKTVLQLDRQAHGIQGAIEDPTAPQSTSLLAGSATDDAMAALLNKFASVLSTGKSPTDPRTTVDMGSVDVVDMARESSVPQGH